MTKTKNTPMITCCEAFTASTRELLSTMALLDAQHMHVCRFRDAGVSRDVGAYMEVKGMTRGVVAAATETKLASRIVARMTGKEDSELTTEETKEGFKEILNIIAGSAKSRLTGQPCHFDLTCPTRWNGDDSAVERDTGADMTAVVFDVGGIRFASAFSFSPR